jgi:type I restriction enzyme M protein
VQFFNQKFIPRRHGQARMPGKTGLGNMQTTAKTAARLAHQVGARHHAQGQGAERRPRPAAAVDLDHVPQVSRRHGGEPRNWTTQLNQAAFRPAIAAPYRWRDWAARQGITGDDLLAFINQDECDAPGRQRGPGLLAYLRGLQSDDGRDRRDVIANVFRGVTNRMINGYLLRDVINKVNGIHFTSSAEIHTLSHLYESMLRELRDAAGDSGEIYTPRPVVRFMVRGSTRKLGETMLDPALGTGGFAVEVFEHLKQQAVTVEQRRILQERSIYGQEAKALPYLLAQMNLLLHGLEFPAIAYGNSLAVKLSEIGDNERVDIILTNPPFGGEEEAGIKANFPDDKQTAETALLFLQLIMRKLRRVARGELRGATPQSQSLNLPISFARAGVVVPNGTLFADGVAARIKEELLKEFNLHTIVRLPNGVFAPYTSIPTNLLFLRPAGRRAEIWYYELPLPEGAQEVHQDPADPVRGVCRLPGLVQGVAAAGE